jgi:hypothetical protein
MKTTILTLSVSCLALTMMLPGCCDSSIGSCADAPAALPDAAVAQVDSAAPLVDAGSDGNPPAHHDAAPSAEASSPDVGAGDVAADDAPTGVVEGGASADAATDAQGD